MSFDINRRLADLVASVEMDLDQGLTNQSEATQKIRDEIIAAFPSPEEQETLAALRDGLAHVLPSKKGLAAAEQRSIYRATHNID